MKYTSFITSHLSGITLAQLRNVARLINLELAKRGLDNE